MTMMGRFVVGDLAAVESAPAMTMSSPEGMMMAPVLKPSPESEAAGADVNHPAGKVAAFLEEAEGLDMSFVHLPEADRGLVRRREGF